MRKRVKKNLPFDPKILAWREMNRIPIHIIQIDSELWSFCYYVLYGHRIDRHDCTESVCLETRLCSGLYPDCMYRWCRYSNLLCRVLKNVRWRVCVILRVLYKEERNLIGPHCSCNIHLDYYGPKFCLFRIF